VKDLLVTVGRQSVVESMAPVAPYTPAKQEQKQRSWKKTFRGERIPLGRRIVFTVELLPYETPNTFREALWRKSLGEQEDAIHQVIPDGLDERSFSTFWSNLLHAEELQVAWVPGRLSLLLALIAVPFTQRKHCQVQYARVHIAERGLAVQVRL